MVLLSLVSRNARPHYLGCFFFVVFKFFVFHCSWFQTVVFCGAFFLVVCRFVMTFVKNEFLITLHFWTYQSSALTRRGQSPLFLSMVFRLVVLFIINNSQSRSWTCWARHIKSVNGFVFFRLSYLDYSDLQLFAIFIFEVDFSVTYFMTSAENSVSEPPNLKILCGGYPQAPLQGSGDNGPP